MFNQLRFQLSIIAFRYPFNRLSPEVSLTYDYCLSRIPSRSTTKTNQQAVETEVHVKGNRSLHGRRMVRKEKTRRENTKHTTLSEKQLANKKKNLVVPTWFVQPTLHVDRRNAYQLLL